MGDTDGYTDAGSVIASISATCRSGEQLHAVQGGVKRGRYQLAYEQPVIITTQSNSTFYQDYQTQRDLGSINTDGTFQAVWVV